MGRTMKVIDGIYSEDLMSRKTSYTYIVPSTFDLYRYWGVDFDELVERLGD